MSYGDWRKEAGLGEKITGALNPLVGKAREAVGRASTAVRAAPASMALKAGIKPELGSDLLSGATRAAKWTWRNKIPLAATAAIGATVVRGARDAREQEARMQDHMNRMRHDLTSVMPSMEVRASYEKLAREKLASNEKPKPTFGAHIAEAGTKAVADALVHKLIASPLEYGYGQVAGHLKRRFSDEPAWRKNFHHVVGSDPMLAQAHSENPSMLVDAFESMKRFSPSLAKDRLATRSLLKHVVLSGGEMDHSVMKMLAETEKVHSGRG